MRPARGFTLVETLVAGTLMVVLLSMTWHLIEPSLRIYEVNQARADIEQTGLVAQYKLSRELLQSTADSFTCITSTPAISFAGFDTTSAGGYDTDTGKANWTKFVIYYLDTDNNILYRKEWPKSGILIQTPVLTSHTFPTTDVSALSASELESICTTENGTETRVAYYVMGLTGSKNSDDTIDVELQLQEESPAGVEFTTRKLTMRPRN